MRRPTQPSHVRVAARYLRARETNDFIALRAALQHLISFADIDYSKNVRPKIWTDIKRAAGVAEKLLDIHVDNEYAIAPDFLGHIKDLRRILHVMSRAAPADLPGLLDDWFWGVLHFVGENLLDMIHEVDTDDEGHTTVGAYSVTLQSAASADWDDEAMVRLHEILEQAATMLNRAGYGKHARGHVHAFPSDEVPKFIAGLPHVDAFYMYSVDKFWLAVRGSNPAYVMVHETGHQVYFKDLSGGARSLWQDFFNENKGGVTLKGVFSDWSKWLNAARTSDERDERGAAGAYLNRLQQINPGNAMIFEIVINEFIHNRETYMTQVSGHTQDDLELLKQLMPKIQVFLHPVTAYSATSAEELFAEVFARYVSKGPNGVAPIVRAIYEHIISR